MTLPEDDAAKARRLGQPVARFMARWREAIRRRPWLEVAYRIIVTVLGALITVIGLILVPLPGPGWLIVFVGLTVLGSEYHWARRLLGWLRRTIARFWERWRAWRAARAARRAERAQQATGVQASDSQQARSSRAAQGPAPAQIEVPEKAAGGPAARAVNSGTDDDTADERATDDSADAA